ncbi:PREDICTED: leucine-rich repeat-containing protein 24-like [Branchiostoma belcheri]|uniref:Leucine-rich repeat-containing protein 24-like n=1 Tax=Branchiostoma belcheri TaxID=7741 RepID=A0A6P4YAX2_BRABE|nr:PREDICTED: leucine-rich repeat-containing protein 24-like [Branchiostoma belcheri]
MARGETLVFLLLVSSYALFVAAQLCPKSCFTDTSQEPLGALATCRCPIKQGTETPCSWVGHGGMYSFLFCLEAIPDDFSTQTRSIFIEHLCSSTLREQSFPNVSNLQGLRIQKSNVSIIEKGAFRGLPLLRDLNLGNNRISSLDPDAFLGLEKLGNLFLDKNMLSAIPQHAFRGLPLRQLILDDNLLTSVPVHALLQLKALRSVGLRKNRITVIDSDVKKLQQHRCLRFVLMGNIKVRCDRWFICHRESLSLSRLSFPRGPPLKCASPAELNGTFISDVSKDICQATTHGPEQQSVSTRSSTANMVPRAFQMVNSNLYNETIVTGNYTEVPHSNNMSASDQTTQMDHVILLGGNPAISDNVRILVSAVAVPLLLVLTTTIVLLIHKFYRGSSNPAQQGAAPTRADDADEATPEAAGDDNIEPYAVAYASAADETELQRCAGSGAAGRPDLALHKTQEDNCTIQPYAVAYAEDPGSGIQPYAVAYDEEQIH